MQQQTFENVQNQIIIMLLAKLNTDAVLLTPQEVANFDADTFWKYKLSVDGEADGSALTVSLIRASERASCAYDLTTQSLKAIAIILTRMAAPVRFDVEDCIQSGERMKGSGLVFYGNEDGSCEISIKPAGEALNAAARQTRELPANWKTWTN